VSRLTRRAARLTAGAAAASLLTAAFTAGVARAATALPAPAAAPGGVAPSGSGPHLLSLPAGYDATADGNSMYNVTLGTGAQAYWKAGYTGQGVGVVLIDSGVSPVPGLDSGNVVYGPDLSIDSQSPTMANYDSFGHGTHMAGIIAGRDAPETGSSPYAGDSTDFVGMAPDAHVVSVKVADTYGDTDVTQLIAAIDWAVQNKDQYNIRVMNLSVGFDPSQSYLVDPLAYAVEQAWAHGIVVVAAAGNDGITNGKKGPGPGSGLQNPAYDPMVLAVGAADTHGTIDTHDDTVASFSSTQGAGRDGDRKPDLVAPGMHIASLLDPGSWIDQTYASTGAVDGRLMRGSGTSQAAAVVSGAAALIISQHPDATPDQVKNLLVHATDHLDRADPGAQGNGELDLTKALNRKLDPWTQPRSHATGTGSLQADRPDGGLVDSSGSQLSGEVDIFGNPISTADLAQAEAAGTGWTMLAGFSAGTAATISPDATSGHTWSGHTWSSGDWAGHTWSGADWAGHTWSGHTWSGHTWSGHTWSASSWADGFWSSAVWE
jgi:serine protease AprX